MLNFSVTTCVPGIVALAVSPPEPPSCVHQAFRDLLATPSLPLEAGFSCVLTVVRILGGAGRVLTVDDSAFTTYLLTSLPRLVFPGCEKDTPAALECVDALLLKRRELASERVGLFIKNLISLAPHVAVNHAMAIVSLVRTLLIRYPGHQQVRVAASVPSRHGVTPRRGNQRPHSFLVSRL